MVKLSSGIVLNPNELTSEDREAIVKALEETKSGVWRPKHGQGYYSIEWDGGARDYIWNNDIVDNNFLAIGNLFPTRESAEKHFTYLKALQVLRGDTKGYEWKPDDTYYTGIWENAQKKLLHDWYRSSVLGGIKFKTKEDIESSFKAHEKEWRIVLGVE